MERVGGYTIIEVMIFLAISGVLFVAAVTLIQGQQGRTQFSQSVRDIDSKLQQYVTEVSASHFPSTQQYTCSVNPLTQRPVLSAAAKSLGTNEDCIFLGRALKFHHDIPSNKDDNITSYTILGRRTEDGVTLVTSFADANPTPVISGLGGSAVDLFDNYNLPFGTKIISAKNNSGNNSAMAGFYIDISQTASDITANKSASLVSYQYPPKVDITATEPKDPAVYDCLTLDKTKCPGLNPITSLPAAFGSWVLCFASAASNQTAKITVNSGPTGIQTKIDFVRCT